jgi:hypothetical protein
MGALPRLSTIRSPHANLSFNSEQQAIYHQPALVDAAREEMHDQSS